jgi:hypothetical protein
MYAKNCNKYSATSIGFTMQPAHTEYVTELNTHTTGDCQMQNQFDQTAQKASFLYRFEHSGVIVYDSDARMIGYSCQQPHPRKQSDFQGMLHLDERPIYKKRVQGQRFPGKWYTCSAEKILYDNLPAYPPYKILSPEYTLVVPNFKDGVSFSSNFESANLRKAIRINAFEYKLVLHEDYNTKGHIQWFHFKVTTFFPKSKAL